MRIWILRKIGDGTWPPEWDCCYGMVIRAGTEAAARKFAAKRPPAGDEGPNVWLDPAKTTCEELTAEGEEGVVIIDFLHG